jgi:hypothetical protein
MTDFNELVASIQERGGLVQPFILLGKDPNGHELRFIFEGMTMRQHYAALAMQGLVAINSKDGLTAEEIAIRAWFMADEMLKAM